MNAESIRMMKSPVAGERESTIEAFKSFEGADASNALVLINSAIEEIAKRIESDDHQGMTKDRIVATCMACGSATVDTSDYDGLIDLYNSDMWNYFHIKKWPTSEDHGQVVALVDQFAHKRMTVIDRF